MSERTYVVGVGMTKFDKPGAKEGDYPDWAREAGEMALADAGVPYTDVGQAYVGYCYGDSTYGQRCLYQLGMTGIPSSTSTTTARRGRRRCSSRGRRCARGSWAAPWRWASRRWRRGSWARSTPTGRRRWTSTSAR